MQRLVQILCVIMAMTGAMPLISIAGTIKSGEIDLSIVGLGAFDKMKTAPASIAKKKTNTKQGTPVWVSCLWDAKTYSLEGFVASGAIQFAGSITLNGKPLATGAGQVTTTSSSNQSHPSGVIGPVQWVPESIGKYTISCNLDPLNVLAESTDRRANNKRMETVTVWREALPGDDFSVSITSPSAGARFTYTADVDVPIRILVAAPFFSLVDQDMINPNPDIRVTIDYTGLDRSETTRSFNHTWDLNTNPAVFHLNAAWLSKRDLAAGQYDITTQIIGGTPPNIIYGPAKRTRFYLDPQDMTVRGEGPTLTPSILQPATELGGTTALTDTVTPATPTETIASAGSATALTGTETPTNTVAPESPAVAAALQQPAMAQPIGEQPAPDPANPRGSGLAAPPNPCSMEVTYYVPQPPVLESSVSAAEVSDQLRIRCDFKAVTETIEWPVCDDNARNKMMSLARSQESDSRFSGMLTIDSLNVGVTTSPLEGGDFSGVSLWSYQNAGSHEVGCEIDNALHYVVENTKTHLRQVVSHKIGALTELERLRSFDPASVIQLATELLQSQIEPLPTGSLARLKPGSAVPAAATDSQSPGFDPRREYRGVNQEQGAAKQDDDLNNPPDPPPDQPEDPG